MQTTDNGRMTRPCAAATTERLRVHLNSSGQWAISGATTRCAGVSERTTTAAAQPLSAQLRTKEGTLLMTANGAITAGNRVYAAASGKVGSSGSHVEGIALNTTTADGDWVEVLPIESDTVTGGTQTLTADDADGTLNTILPGVERVYVDAVTNGANDWIVLPSLASVPNGHRICVVGQAGANFEVRTPAGSAEEINSEDCDGTKEYLFTDTQIHYFVKIDNTIGWMGHGFSAIGAVVTAVVPD